MTRLRERHIAPYGAVHHTADRRCQCGPRAMYDLLEPAVVCYVHRRPTIEDRLPTLDPGALAERSARRRGEP